MEKIDFSKSVFKNRFFLSGRFFEHFFSRITTKILKFLGISKALEITDRPKKLIFFKAIFDKPTWKKSILFHPLL